MRVLLIKMSSLGDVVHALAAVTDAARAKPGIHFDWVVEEAYREIPKWHPAVGRTILSPLRRWRKSLVQTLRTGEWKRFREELRREHYDLALDAQGLLKSAFVGLQARGDLCGRSASTAREPAAALLYTKRIRVNRELTEVEQLRDLFAKTLGYEKPRTAAEFGIDRQQFSRVRKGDYALLLHGAAWETKLWPEERWFQVGQRIREAGLDLLLPWGSDAERERAERIAGKTGGEVLAQMTIAELAKVIAHAAFAVGLDTGLTHIAIALGVRTVTLYGPSVPVYDGIAGGGLVNLCSTKGRVVDTSRRNMVAVNDVIKAVERWL